MSHPPLFDELVINAFDFLETAFEEFKDKPKYSVVHFCIAVELLLKARLMHEHWSLIVEGAPDIRRFKKGDFKSINFKDLIPRIENVLDEKIPAEAKKCFDKIANHRNKMVHFFHEADVSAKKKLLDEIVIEQCTGWFFLRRMLARWPKVFGTYHSRIVVLNNSMKAHHIYLKTVYDNIKGEIAQKKQRGFTYCKCSNCGFEASRENILTDRVIECSCEVCLLEENILRLCCDECGKEFDIYKPGDCECSHCHAKMGKEDVEDQIDTEPTTTDNYFDKIEVNCAACGGYHSVVKHQKYWVCLECLGIESEMAVCGWCNEGQIAGGNLEHSYQTGCEFCEGHAGWTRDD